MGYVIIAVNQKYVMENVIICDYVKHDYVKRDDRNRDAALAPTTAPKIHKVLQGNDGTSKCFSSIEKYHCCSEQSSVWGF